MRSLLTVLAVGLFGCQATPAVKKSEAASAPQVILSLQRTACFGACPAYLVEVLSDGTMRFKGERHVRVTEAVEVKLEPAVVEKLQSRFERTDFAHWPDFDQPTTMDLPTVVLRWRDHVVRHALGDEKAPLELTKLEDEVDALLGTERWVKGAGADTK